MMEWWILWGLGVWSVLGFFALLYFSDVEIRSRWLIALIVFLCGPLAWAATLLLAAVFRKK
jgi:hypothetical protein